MTPHLSVLRSSRRLFQFLPIPCVIAAVTFGLSVAHSVFPGYSTVLTAAAVGVTSPSGANHPIFACAARLVASWDFFTLPLRLNLFSVCCGTLCAVLFYYLVGRLILFSACEDAGGAGRVDVTEEDDMQEEEAVSELPPEVAEYNRRMVPIAVTGGLIAAVLFTFSTAVWSASTRLDNGMFDLLLALVSLALFPIGYPRFLFLRLLLSVFFFAMGLSESAVFLLLLPFYAYIVFDLLVFSPQRIARVISIGVVGLAALALSAYAFDANSCHASTWTLAMTARAYVRAVIGHHGYEVLSFFPRSGWLLLVLQPGLSAAVLLFGQRLLFKEKMANTVIALVILTGSVLPGLLNVSCSPFYIFQEMGHLPVFGYAILAAAAAVGFSACWVVVGRGDDNPANVEVSSDGETIRLLRQRWVSRFAGLMLPVYLMLIIAVPWRSRCAVDNQRGAFADEVAREMLAAMNGRTCLVSNGLMDTHLLIQAFMKGQPLTLITLHAQAAPSDTARLEKLIETSPLFNNLNRQRLRNALSIGDARFVQEWFNADTNSVRRAMIFATPDLWVACGLRPVPEGLAFGAVRPDQNPDIKELLEQNGRFFKRISPLLAVQETERDFVAGLRRRLRMRMGFSANELGVLLEDAGDLETAYGLYTQALEIDPSNVSAAINGYALVATKGLHVEKVDALRKRTRRLLENRNIGRREELTAILQNFGSIRQQAFYAEQAAAWSASGTHAVSTAKLNKALSLSTQTGLASLLENALVHLHTGAAEKAESCYLAVLDKDESNKDALLGLCTLMVGKGNVHAAEAWMKKARQAGLAEDQLRYQAIALALMRKDTQQALSLLNEATKKCPTDLRYWTLLADLLLSQGDSQMVEFRILPEMQKILKSDNHFLVHSIRGFLLQKKGPKFYREARLSLLAALALNAALPDIWNALFELDQALNNPEFIEADSRALLKLEPDHALANYLCGAQLLVRGALLSSEDFLRRSVEKMPTAAACNDLAENLRLQKKPAEAEVFARRALEMDRNLLPAMDTLANVQCDAGNLEEARKLAAQTVAEKPNNPYYQLTLLRVLVRQGDQEGVREILTILGESKTAIPAALQKEIETLNRAATK